MTTISSTPCTYCGNTLYTREVNMDEYSSQYFWALECTNCSSRKPLKERRKGCYIAYNIQGDQIGGKWFSRLTAKRLESLESEALETTGDTYVKYVNCETNKHFYARINYDGKVVKFGGDA